MMEMDGTPSDPAINPYGVVSASVVYAYALGIIQTAILFWLL